MDTLEKIISRRISRRGFVTGFVATAVSAYAAGKLSYKSAFADKAEDKLRFTEIPHAVTDTLQIPDDYTSQILLRWGDVVLPGAPQFDALKQTAAAQKMQYGYNNDYAAFMPLPYGSGSSTSGLLCINHEYTIGHLMFPGLIKSTARQLETKEQMEVELAAHGHSVVEVVFDNGAWKTIPNSKYNRRFNAIDTEFELTGPAAGHARLKTTTDPSGKKVTGTFANCSGGVTPWGTILFCEENIDLYFENFTDDNPEAQSHRQFGFKEPLFSFSRFWDRFDLKKEPNEPHRFGWVIEYDPYNPESKPVKRTALGRFAHEAANTALAANGRVVVYMGDDSYFEYLYKFVSHRPYDPANRQANMNLLNEGTLYAAKFTDDGTLEWLPLIYGQGVLDESNGFRSQADVLIEARRASDIMGATKMDRPEDVEPSPVTGKVYISLTKNKKREATNAANPRAKNLHGHIIELSPPTVGGKPDHGAEKFRWDIFLLAGKPTPLSNPDNLAFDNRGNMWVATDGMDDVYSICDGLYVVATDGVERAKPRHFMNAPLGAEITGPAFTPDCKTLFVNIQHPGDAENSTFDNPTTGWPDFKTGSPPRPSLVAIRRKDGGEIGLAHNQPLP